MTIWEQKKKNSWEKNHPKIPAKNINWSSLFFLLLLRVNLIIASDKPECRKCAKALQELENIDDEADQLGIGFVKIHDELLADEYNLGELPRLVYYRHKTPIIYESEFLANDSHTWDFEP